MVMIIASWIGTILTCLALYNAWRAMRRGNHEQVQRMFRARIGAQAFTVCAIVAGGTYYGADREKRKELIKLEAQQRAEERHQKWLHELEVRDEEEQLLKDHLKRRRERVEAKKSGQANEGSTGDQAPTQQTDGGSGIIQALSSSTGGWFGTGKNAPTSEEENKKNEAGEEPAPESPKK
jgi:hypothetical protein